MGNNVTPQAIAQATLLEAITRALPASQIKAIQQQQIVAAEEEMERLERAGSSAAPTGRATAPTFGVEKQRLGLSAVLIHGPVPAE